MNERKIELLLSLGYSIIPLIDKTPLPKGWQKGTPLTFDEVKSYKGNNYGLVCGHMGVEVIDVDLKVLPSLEDRKTKWNEITSLINDNLEDADKKLVIVKTKNNGYHILYRANNIEGNQRLAMVKKDKALIETRGIGGQVVMYDELIQGDYTTIQYITDRERDIIIQCCRFFNIFENEVEYKPRKTNNLITGLTAWDDYNDKVDIWTIIQSDFKIVRQLSDRVILKRIGSENAQCGSILTASNLLYLFTPNTCYPERKGLSAFACYTYKHHNGDFSQASKELYRQGYGERIKPEKTFKYEDKSPIEVDFPIDIFPKDIQDYIIECNRTLNNSVDYMCASMLWMLSVIFGNAFKIKVKNGWIESPILWMILVGKQGIGKSPSIANIIKPLIELNTREHKRYNIEKKRYDEYQALDKEEKKQAIEVSEPKKKQFIAVDITLESLIELHEGNPNAVGIFRDEVAGWIKDMNKYRAGSDVEHWLSSWSNSPIYLNRKTAKSSYVSSPHMAVLGGVQPTIFEQFYTDENKENGFIDRLLITFPELTIDEYNEAELSEEQAQYYNTYITHIYEQVKNGIYYDKEGEISPYICTWSADAKKEWIRIFNKITTMQNADDESEYMKSMLPKQKSYIPRFALLIHLLDQYFKQTTISLQIEKETILKAERVSDYFIMMAKKVKVGNQKRKNIKKIIDSGADKAVIVKDIVEQYPEIKKTELADMLGVSRQTIYDYLNN